MCVKVVKKIGDRRREKREGIENERGNSQVLSPSLLSPGSPSVLSSPRFPPPTPLPLLAPMHGQCGCDQLVGPSAGSPPASVPGAGRGPEGTGWGRGRELGRGEGEGGA